MILVVDFIKMKHLQGSSDPGVVTTAISHEATINRVWIQGCNVQTFFSLPINNVSDTSIVVMDFSDLVLASGMDVQVS